MTEENRENPEKHHHEHSHEEHEFHKEPEHHPHEHNQPEHHSHEYDKPHEHHKPEHHEHKPHIDNEPDKKNPWITISFILGIAIIVLLFLMYRGGITREVIGVDNTVSEDSAGEAMLNFANMQGANAELIGVEEEEIFYKVTLRIQGQNIPIYVTKDGKYFTSSLIPLSNDVQPPEIQRPSTPEPIEVSIDDDAVKGDPNAPVTIVEFSDYECPFCGKHFHQTYPQIISEYVDTGKVKIVFRDFPLGFHEKAQKAAEAAECAGEQGKYWEMHDKLFENQKSLDTDSLKQYAGDINLNTVEFNTCLDTGEMAEEVQKDMNEGSKYGVTGTPAFFINRRMLSGAQPFSAFKTIIEEELSN